MFQCFADSCLPGFYFCGIRYKLKYTVPIISVVIIVMHQRGRTHVHVAHVEKLILLLQNMSVVLRLYTYIHTGILYWQVYFNPHSELSTGHFSRRSD